MKNRILIFVTALIMIGTHAYADNGDLIVDGNMGVGTPAPSTKLAVTGGISATGIAGYNAFGTGTIIGGDGTNALVYGRNNALWAPMYIDASKLYLNAQTGGNVGIGTTNFTYGGKLTIKRSSGDGGGLVMQTSDFSAAVSGSMLQNSFGADTGNTYAVINNTVNGGTVWGNLVLQSGGGNVGIGTTSPVGKLEVRGGTVIAGYAGGQLKIAGGTVDGGVWTGADDVMRIADWNTGTKGMVVNLTSGNVGIGTPSPAGKLDVWGQIYQSGSLIHSDIKFKKNLLPITDPVNKILGLNGFSYEWRSEEFRDRGFPEGRHYGVIAQEVEKVLPEVVTERPDGTKTVAYTEIIPVLIEAVKEQQKVIEKQQQELAEIRSLVGRLSAAHSR